MQWRELCRRGLDALAMALVAGVSFLLLLYVGHGEARRSFERYHLDKLAAQGRMLQGAIESFLRRDLPLPQYVGFRARAERLRAADDGLVALAVYDLDGRSLFVSGDPDIALLPATSSPVGGTIDGGEVRKHGRHLQIILPLANRYERVGNLALTVGWSAIDATVEAQFRPLLYAAIAFSILFALVVAGARAWLARERTPWLQILYAGFFLVMAGLVIASMVKLYSRGAQLEVKALADSLGQRMTEIIGFHLDLQQLQGLDRAFSEYRRLNPDISAVALIVDGRIAIHTDPFLVGRPWSSDASTYEYRVDVTPPGSSQQIGIAVTLPEDIVYGRILRNAKNFAALFVASAFLANLFLQLAGTLRRTGPPATAASSDRTLALVKPLFYMAMCIEHLIYPFMPQYIHSKLATANFSDKFASLIFVTYYVCFALTLIPAGYLTQRFGSRRSMAAGLSLTTVGLLALLLPGTLLPMVLGRACAGVGQALLFIGVQSYILAVASPQRKTRGAVIIVFGFQGGMIAGMAIGSLLVVYLGPEGVFALGALAAALTTLYAATMMPTEPVRPGPGVGFTGALAQLGDELRQALRNRGLLETIALIGIPAKAVLTGVIVFALPLLMTERGYLHEDIGQMLMIYAGGVVVASSLIARVVDRTGGTITVLGGGALLSGLGLGLISLVDASALGHGNYAAVLETILLVLAILIVGGAHGLINAPAVTHVAGLGLARQIGAGATTAAYRFLERIGHVAGPLVVGQLLLLRGGIGTALQWIGMAVALLGLIFLALQRRQATSQRSATDLIGLYVGPPDLALVLTVDEERPSGREGRRPIEASATGSDPGDPERIRRLQDFLARVASGRPARKQLRLIGCGDPTCYRIATRHAAAIDIQLVPTAGEWLEQVRPWLTGTIAAGSGQIDPVVDDLRHALGNCRSGKQISEHVFVWTKPPLTTRPVVTQSAVVESVPG